MTGNNDEFFICTSCGERFTMDLSTFLQTNYIKCGNCGKEITGGKVGIDRQIEYMVKKSELISAIKLRKSVTGDSLLKSKEYVENLALVLGVEFKTKPGVIGIIIFCLIAGLIVSYILKSIYPPAIFFVSSEVFGISPVDENTGSLFIGAIFYGLILFILLNFKKIIKKIAG